jgi:hypothetical protein
VDEVELYLLLQQVVGVELPQTLTVLLVQLQVVLVAYLLLQQTLLTDRE